VSELVPELVVRHGGTQKSLCALLRRHHFLHTAICTACCGVSQELLLERGHVAVCAVERAVLLERLRVSVLLQSIASFASGAGAYLSDHFPSTCSFADTGCRMEISSLVILDGFSRSLRVNRKGIGLIMCPMRGLSITGGCSMSRG